MIYGKSVPVFLSLLTCSGHLSGKGVVKLPHKLRINASCALVQVLVSTTGGDNYTAGDALRLLQDLNLTQQVSLKISRLRPCYLFCSCMGGPTYSCVFTTQGIYLSAHGIASLESFALVMPMMTA